MTTHVTDAEWNVLSDTEKRAYVWSLEVLVSERDRLMAVIPECPAHGKGCIPYALEWIARLKKIAVMYYGDRVVYTPPSSVYGGLYEGEEA